MKYESVIDVEIMTEQEKPVETLSSREELEEDFKKEPFDSSCFERLLDILLDENEIYKAKECSVKFLELRPEPEMVEFVLDKFGHVPCSISRKIDLYRTMAEICIAGKLADDLPSALKVLETRNCAPEITLLRGDLLIEEGVKAQNSGKDNQARSILEDAIHHLQLLETEDNDLKVRRQFKIGQAFLLMENRQQSAFDIFEEINFSNDGISGECRKELLCKIGEIYENIGNYDKAIEKFRRVERYDIKFKLKNISVAQKIDALKRKLIGIKESKPDPPLPDRYGDPIEIGRGGMGVVYRVFDRELKKPVVIKRPYQYLKGEKYIMERFRHEANISMQLSNKFVIKVHHYKEKDDFGLPYMVMEWLEGSTLREIIEENKSKGLKKNADWVIDIATQLLQALDYIHNENHNRPIVHRDLKPENIFVTRSNEVKLMDFGLAKMADFSFKSRSNEKLGTAYYMSPEQHNREADRITHKTDIWSFGVLLYEMLAEELPFKSLGAILTETPVPLARYRKNSGEGIQGEKLKDLERIILKCLEKELENRYANVREITDDLTNVTGNGNSVEPADRNFLEKILEIIFAVIKIIRRWDLTVSRSISGAVAGFLLLSLVDYIRSESIANLLSLNSVVEVFINMYLMLDILIILLIMALAIGAKLDRLVKSRYSVMFYLLCPIIASQYHIVNAEPRQMALLFFGWAVAIGFPAFAIRFIEKKNESGFSPYKATLLYIAGYLVILYPLISLLTGETIISQISDPETVEYIMEMRILLEYVVVFAAVFFAQRLHLRDLNLLNLIKKSSS